MDWSKPSDPPQDAGNVDSSSDSSDFVEVGPTGHCDAGMCAEPEAGSIAPCTPPDKLDVLFVLDDSVSMTTKRMLLIGQLPTFFESLLSGDVDKDGEEDFTPFVSVHAGVISSDLGVPIEEARSLGCTASGDDGRLRALGDLHQLGCAPSYTPPFVVFNRTTQVSAALDLECIIRAFDGRGCGFEQPLEAALKALTDASSPIRFVRGQGQAESYNAGFLREDAMLLVLVITDEDDCSMADFDLARRESHRYREVSMNMRCAATPEALLPLSRYLHGLRGLKARPDDVVFATIAGVPEDLVSTYEPGIYREALQDDRMQVRPLRPDDPYTPPTPACIDSPNLTSADPARRLLELADMFGKNSVAQSLCAGDVRPALQAVVQGVARTKERYQCSADECPCASPFFCHEGRCVCDAAVACGDNACDAILDGCGGAQWCGRCPGTAICAFDGTPNHCGIASTCPPGKVCVDITPQTQIEPRSAAVWLLDELDENGAPYRESPLAAWVTPQSPAQVDGGPTLHVEVDVSATPVGVRPEEAFVAVLLRQETLGTHAVPGDEWYVHPRKLYLTADAIIDLGSQSSRLIPLTADDTTTPGIETEGIFACGDSSCASRCCAKDEPIQCADWCTNWDLSWQCDGPEDCGKGHVCCVIPSETSMEAACMDDGACETRLCHNDTHCPDGHVCQGATFAGHLMSCAALP